MLTFLVCLSVAASLRGAVALMLSAAVHASHRMLGAAQEGHWLFTRCNREVARGDAEPTFPSRGA